jgi:hypothetical protein
MPAGVVTHVAPGSTSASTTHGGFDDDPATLAQVIAFVKAAAAVTGKPPPARGPRRR